MADRGSIGQAAIGGSCSVTVAINGDRSIISLHDLSPSNQSRTKLFGHSGWIKDASECSAASGSVCACNGSNSARIAEAAGKLTKADVAKVFEENLSLEHMRGVDVTMWRDAKGGKFANTITPIHDATAFKKTAKVYPALQEMP